MTSKEPRKERIETTLREGLSPKHLVVENESSKHSVPPGSETHFKVLIVSDAFESLNRIERHRRVHDVLARELKSGLHALTIRALSGYEWTAAGETTDFVSPPCAGGSKNST